MKRPYDRKDNIWESNRSSFEKLKDSVKEHDRKMQAIEETYSKCVKERGVSQGRQMIDQASKSIWDHRIWKEIKSRNWEAIPGFRKKDTEQILKL